MNPEDKPLTPREQTELQLTALLMGELSHEQAAALHLQMAADPQLAALHGQLRHAMTLLREACVTPPQPGTPSPARLSDHRRAKLLAHFQTQPAAAAAPTTPNPIIRLSQRSWWVPITQLAAILVILAVVVLPNLLRSRKRSQATRIMEDLRMVDQAVDQYAIEANNGSFQMAAAPSSFGRGASISLESMPKSANEPAAASAPELASAEPVASPAVSTPTVSAIVSSTTHSASFAMASAPLRAPAAPPLPAEAAPDPRAFALNTVPSEKVVDFFTSSDRLKSADAPAEREAAQRDPAARQEYAKNDFPIGGKIALPQTEKKASGESSEAIGSNPVTAGNRSGSNQIAPTDINGLTDKLATGIEGFVNYGAPIAGGPVIPPTTFETRNVGGTAEVAPIQGKPSDRANANGGKDVQYLYSLRDGQLVGTDTASAASSRNPVNGRIATWTDDESTKLNIDTKSEGTFWDAPARGASTPADSKPGESAANKQLSADNAMNAVIGQIREAGNQNDQKWISQPGLTRTFDDKGSADPSKQKGQNQSAAESKKLMAEADGYFQSGRYDLANKRTEQVLSHDAYNLQARKMEEKINEARQQYAASAYDESRARAVWKVDNAWQNPVRKSDKSAATNEQEKGKLISAEDAEIYGDATPQPPATKAPLAKTAEQSAQKEDSRRKGEVSKESGALASDADKDGFAALEEYRAKGGTAPPAPASSPASAAEPPRQLALNKPQAPAAPKPAPAPKVEPAKPAQAEDAKKPATAPAPADEPQPEIATSANAFSTFSLNVSDVSFKLAAASLEQKRLPEPATVRSEEFLNALDYRDPEPAAGAPLAFASERARYPFAQNRDLLRLSVKTAAAGRQLGRPLNIVLLLDNSGSMERADRVRIVREAIRVLATKLQPQDKLSVVTFARTPRLWADGVAGNQAAPLAERISELPPQGGTDLGAALDLGYQTALRHYQVDTINRVVLLTDGAANLGDVNPDALKQKVEAYRKQGVALDCFGIGWEDYDDTLLEALARNGDGRYGFINTPEEATTGFAAQLAGALRVAASDVKVQVEFNPRRVRAYRQIGYAKHQLKKEQFRDNTVDAAEIGAAESGNALYAVEVNPRGEGDLAIVRVRYKVPGTTDYREQEWKVPFESGAQPLSQASPSLRLAASVSAFAEWLAGSPYAAEVSTDQLLALLNGVPATYGADPRPKKLEWMIRQAKSLTGR